MSPKAGQRIKKEGVREHRGMQPSGKRLPLATTRVKREKSNGGTDCCRSRGEKKKGEAAKE